MSLHTVSMRSSELKMFIREHSDLFWYTPAREKEKISDELLVETILNYGTLTDFKDMSRLMGIKTIADTFFGMEGRKKMNFYPEIYHFFYLYFNKYAQGNT